MTYERLIYSVVIVLLEILLLSRFIYFFLRSKHLAEEIALRKNYEVEQRKYYEAFIKKYEGLQGFHHDFQNHMHVLFALLQENKYEEGKGYLKKIMDTYAKLYIRDLGNGIVNCLWAQYFSEWEERRELQATIIGRFPERMPMEEMDVCVLFGNAFSNAAEAMKDLPERKMEIEVKHTEEELCVWIKNSIDNTYIDIEESTKRDKENHGIGVKHMRKTVKKYGGDISWETEDDTMVVSVFLQWNK